MQITIIAARIFKQIHATDKIYLETNIPDPFNAVLSHPVNLVLRFDVPATTADNYLDKHFPGVPKEYLT